MKCQTFMCAKERLEGSAHCPICTLHVEKHWGGFGFAPHGRDQSDLVKRAIAVLDERRAEASA